MSRPLQLPSDEGPEQSARLARALKTLRRRKGLTVVEMAVQMSLGHRTYELFEAGGGKLSFAKIQRFADITDVDPWGIILSLAFEDDTLAMSCVDNKLMTAALMALRDFTREAGGDLALLDARTLMTELDAACESLVATAKDRRLPAV